MPKVGLLVLLIGQTTPVVANDDPALTPEAFIRAYFEEQARGDSPGLAYAYVADGRVQAVGGLGTADLGSGRAVDATTAFRIASISKVFVSLAALTLVDDGRLDLDRPVRDIVPDIAIDNPFPEPVTVRHLLTHRAGFDDRFYGDMARDPARQQPLGAHLARRLPPVVGRPGTAMSYSNYGYALVGYVVETIAGQRFADYVTDEVFRPLGMHSTGFDLTASLRARLAVGYRKQGDQFEPQPYSYVHRYPPTSLMTTAADMARFIRAMVNGTCLEARCLLSERTRSLVYRQQATNHPDLPGRTLTFMQWARNSVPGLWHDGGHVGFLAELIIFPEIGSGLFLAVNEKTTGVSGRLKRDLLDRWLPYDRPPPKAAAPADPSRFTGLYVFGRRSTADFEKIAGLLRPPLSITEDSEGRLHFRGLTLIPTTQERFVEAEKGRFQMIFAEGEDGTMRAFVDWGGSPKTLIRLSAVEHPVLHLLLFALFLIADLLIGVLLVRRAEWLGGWGPVLASAFGVLAAFIVGLGIVLTTTTSTEFRFAETFGLTALSVLPIAATVLLGAFAVWVVGYGPRTRWRWAVLAYAAAHLLFLHHWRLIGFITPA